MNNKGKLAISQIGILVISIFAIAYIIGGMPMVSAGGAGLDVLCYGGVDVYPSLYSIKEKIICGFYNWFKGITNPFKGPNGKLTSTEESFLKGAEVVFVWVVTYAILRGVFDKMWHFDERGDITKHVAEATSSSMAFSLVNDILGLGKTLNLPEIWVWSFVISWLSDKDYRIVKFNCELWQPKIGGEDCSKCNDREIGELEGIDSCTEYQCHTLGSACEWDTESAVCYSMPDNKNPPVIGAWQGALEKGYSYTPLENPSPNLQQVKLVYDGSDDGCIPAYDKYSLGITASEDVQCRFSTSRGNYDEMTDSFDEGWGQNHSIDSEMLEVRDLTETKLTYYVKCQDRYGNENPGAFSFKMCFETVDENPPEVLGYNPSNGAPIAFETGETEMTLYLNEPSECKWSTVDKDMGSMENSMDCATDAGQFESTPIDGQRAYACKTTLTNLQDRTENKFYIRCKDKPGQNESERNAWQASQEYTLIGTQPLVMDEAGPNGTIKGSGTFVPVTLTAKTSQGYDEGKALCSFRDLASNRESYSLFLNTNSYTHSIVLTGLDPGEYNYEIKCTDEGLNADYKEINFEVQLDNDAPVVVRTYKDEGNLKIITNENASCVYDTSSCIYSFGDGIPLSGEGNSHSISWNTNVKYYIKCKDEYGNQPAGDDCNAIIQALE